MRTYTGSNPFLSINKRLGLVRLSLAASILLTGQAMCQNIDMHFFVYQTDTKFGDSFQAKLLSGGQDATLAIKKMPDLVRQGHATLLAELKKQVPSAQRDAISSGNPMHKFRDGTLLNVGLNITFEPSVVTDKPSTAKCLLSLTYTDPEDKAVKQRDLDGAFFAKSAVPLLLARWQEGDSNLMLVVSATWVSADVQGGASEHMIYLDNTIYETEADATNNRNPISRTFIPANFRTSTGIPIEYKREDEWILDDKYSASINSEIGESEDGSKCTGIMYLNHPQITGKMMNDDEIRRPEVIQRLAALKRFSINFDTPMTMDLSVEKNANGEPKAPDWKLTTKCIKHEVK